ncbi:MAG: Smr/MutS family protein [Bacilli bacterium]
MKKANNNIFIDMYPSVDMHGLDRESARVLTDDFVKENIKLGNKKIIIIHGKGSHIVKQSVHQELNKNQYVEDYKLDNFNDGITVVSLKVDK